MQKHILTIVIFVTIIMGFSKIDSSASDDIPIRETDVSQPSAGNVFIAADGYYNDLNVTNTVNRVNQIRKEAYDLGLVGSYVPIQWDNGLEWIAQIRSAESAMYYGHYRPNGKYFTSMKYNGVSLSTENLASYAYSMQDISQAIDMWYSEKADYIATGSVSDNGHYWAMINPSNKYFAMSTFSPINRGYTSASAEFSASSTGETVAGVRGRYIQKVEASTEKIGKVGITNASPMEIGENRTLKLEAVDTSSTSRWDIRLADRKGAILTGVTWSSSNNNVATVDSAGNIKAKSKGSTKITASSNGLSSSITVFVGKDQVSGSLSGQNVTIGWNPYLPTSAEINWNNGTKSTCNITWFPVENDYSTLNGADYIEYGVADGKLITKSFHIEPAVINSLYFPDITEKMFTFSSISYDFGSSPKLPSSGKLRLTSGGSGLEIDVGVTWSLRSGSEPIDITDPRPQKCYMTATTDFKDVNGKTATKTIVVHQRAGKYTLDEIVISELPGVFPSFRDNDENAIPNEVTIHWEGGLDEKCPVEWDTDEIRDNGPKTYQQAAGSSYYINGEISSKNSGLFGTIPIKALVKIENVEIKDTDLDRRGYELWHYFDKLDSFRGNDVFPECTTTVYYTNGKFSHNNPVVWDFDKNDYEDIFTSKEGGTFTAPYHLLNGEYSGTCQLTVLPAEPWWPIPVYSATTSSAGISELTIEYDAININLPRIARIRWTNNDRTYEKITWDDISYADKHVRAGHTFELKGTIDMSQYDYNYKDPDQFRTLDVSIKITQSPATDYYMGNVDEETFPDEIIRNSLMNEPETNEDGSLDFGITETLTVDSGSVGKSRPVSFDGLEKLSKLSSLFIYNCWIKDCDFTNLPKVSGLTLVNCKLDNVKLSDNEHIKSVFIQDCEYENLSVTKNLKALVIIDSPKVNVPDDFNPYYSGYINKSDDDGFDISSYNRLQRLYINENSKYQYDIRGKDTLNMIFVYTENNDKVDLSNIKGIETIGLDENIFDSDTNTLKLDSDLAEKDYIFNLNHMNKKYDYKYEFKGTKIQLIILVNQKKQDETTEEESTESTEKKETTESTENKETTESTENKETTESSENKETSESTENKETSESTEDKNITDPNEENSTTESLENKETTESTREQETTEDLKKTVKKKKPKKVKIKSVKNLKKKKIKVSFKKLKADGYQIQIARNKSFTKGKKSINTKKNTYLFKKMKKNKKYYIRVRAYNKYNEKIIYGSWSKVKTVKISK